MLQYLFNGQVLKYIYQHFRKGFSHYNLIRQFQSRFPGVQIDAEVKLTGVENMYIAPGVKIDKGCYLNAGGRNYGGKDGRIELGAETLLGYHSKIFAGGGEIYIGKRVRIGLGAIISAQSENPFIDPDRPPDQHQHIFEKVIIGNHCMIAGGAMITGGTELGDNCIVGAGAVVKGKYPEGTTLIGNPARAIPRLPFQKQEL
jgi:acetyltransferase-like isoleucine patch superfamily enzyme